MTELNTEVFWDMGVGAGLGAVLQGSKPSSYTEFANGFSSTKLPPKPTAEDEPAYRCAGLGELNIVEES